MSLATIDASDLIALSIDLRFGRIADAAERTATNSERIAVALLHLQARASDEGNSDED